MVELLVVLAITGMVMAAMVTNYRGGVRQNSLRNAADEMIAVLRQNQTAAASGAQYNGSAVADYRVGFDLDDTDSYKVCVGSPFCAQNVVQTVNLPDEIYLKSITLEGQTPISASDADVIFLAPFGDVSLNANSFSNQTTRILAVVLTNYEQDVVVKIDPISGRISYELQF